MKLKQYESIENEDVEDSKQPTKNTADQLMSELINSPILSPLKTSSCFYRKRSKSSLRNVNEPSNDRFLKTLSSLNCENSSVNENTAIRTEAANCKQQIQFAF